MPQASENLRALMGKWFGDDIDDAGPTNFLLARGWTLDRSGYWSKPVRAYNASYYEFRCLNFLIDEWNHGTIQPIYWDGDPDDDEYKWVA